MAKICARCGAKMGDDKKFCTACGNKLESVAPAGNVCSCGARIVPGRKFCTVCGKPTAAAAEPVKRSPAEEIAVCPKCHNALKPGVKFCTTCGQKLNTVVAPMPKAAAASEPEENVATPMAKAPDAARCSCGAINRPGVKFCTTCGKPLQAAAPSSAAEDIGIHCSCGAVNRPGVKFCTACGKELGAVHIEPKVSSNLKRDGEASMYEWFRPANPGELIGAVMEPAVPFEQGNLTEVADESKESEDTTEITGEEEQLPQTEEVNSVDDSCTNLT